MCEFTASTSYNLKVHKQSKHEGIRYPCDMCEYAVTRQWVLKVHKESKHEGNRYPCDIYVNMLQQS